MDYKALTLLLFSFLTIPFSNAELRDPTKPAFYSSNKETVYTQTNELTLSSIWISSRSKRATINGVTAKQGETILTDVKIIKILTGSVLIEQKGIIRKLSLLTQAYKTK